MFFKGLEVSWGICGKVHMRMIMRHWAAPALRDRLWCSLSAAGSALKSGISNLKLPRHRQSAGFLKNETLRYRAGTNLVLVDPDVRKAFRSERAVNDALRLVIELPKVGSYKRRGYSSNGA